MQQAEHLFEAILKQHSGVVFSRAEAADAWSQLANEGRIRLDFPELLAQLESLHDEPEARDDKEFPMVLSAGERRDYTANTIYRHPGWRRKDAEGALRLNPDDAQRLGLVDGGQARITTRAGSALTSVAVTERMQSGHISLPNGFGLDNLDGERSGVAVNELTSLDNRDPLVGTPYHKFVRARVEAV